MVHFPILRTKRMTLQLRELTIGQSIALAALPSHLEQAETTAFLRYARESVQGVASDPLTWTVQERMFAVCHYIAATSADGPDFSVGKGRYSDYFDGAKEKAGDQIDVGELGGDLWSIVDLTGRDAETIERLKGELKDGAGNPIEGKLHWILGAMAAQLRRKEDEAKPEAEGEYEHYLLDRMKVFAAFPESDFMALMVMFYEGRAKLAHFFNIDFSDAGIIAMPMEAAADNLPPARFPISSCLCQGTLGLVRHAL